MAKKQRLLTLFINNLKTTVEFCRGYMKLFTDQLNRDKIGYEILIY